MATIKASQLLMQALRLLKNHEPSDEQMLFALFSFNNLLSSFSVEGNLIHKVTAFNNLLTDGTGSYTIGSGGAFNTTRPVQILDAFIRDSSSVDYPVEIIGYDRYNSIEEKSTEERPDYLYYNPAFPLGIIYFWGVPSNSTDNIHLTNLVPLSELSDITDEISLPDEYKRMLIYNLAVEISSEYDKVLSPDVTRIAEKTRSDIKALNAVSRIQESKFDSAITTRIFRGYGL